MERHAAPRAIKVVRFLVRPLLMLLTRRDWRGAENLPDGGFVLAPNHVSQLDPFTLGHWMLDNGIAPRFLAKDTLMHSRLVGWILRAAEQIPVYRGTDGAAESLHAAIEAVEAGAVVTIYPEGTITRDPAAWPMTGRTGAVRVALATGRPLVPVMQWGPQDVLWPYAKMVRLLPRKTMHVRVGEPLDLTAYEGRPLTEELLREATEILMDRLTQMQAEVRGELPTTPRIDVHTLGRLRTTYRGEN